MIRHHLSDALIHGHAAGTLPEAFGLIVATHVSLCDTCRARVLAAEAVGGAVLEGTEAEMAPGALEACLARLGAQDGQAPSGAPVRARPAVRRPEGAPLGALPAPLADYIGGNLSAVRWTSLGMGVRQAILPTSKRASARLLYIPAGQAVPDHGHRGQELTLVLQGAFRDETDRFGPGDVEIAGEELNHKPVAEAGMDCICLAATDAPLRFKDWLPRMLQPLFRI